MQTAMGIMPDASLATVLQTLPVSMDIGHFALFATFVALTVLGVA